MYFILSSFPHNNSAWQTLLDQPLNEENESLVGKYVFYVGILLILRNPLNITFVSWKY